MRANRKTIVIKHFAWLIPSAKETTKDGFKEIKMLSVRWCKQQQGILSSSVSYFSWKQ